MTQRYVDRGGPTSGLIRSGRDHGLPPNAIRVGGDFSTPDQRIRKREGFAPYNSEQVTGQALVKQRGNEENSRIINSGSSDSYDKLTITPRSYGVISWHNQFQPETTKNFTLQFELIVGEVDYINSTDARLRETLANYSGSKEEVRADVGALVYDQSCICNDIDFVDSAGNNGSVNPTNSVSTGVQPSDHFIVSTLSVGYSTDWIRAHVSFLDTASNRYHINSPSSCILQFNIGTYTTGTKYNVAVRFNSSNQTISLVVDGVEADTFVVPSNWQFPGQSDFINGKSQAIQRDIVLLNESTVRGHQNSTIHLTHAESADTTVRHDTRAFTIIAGLETFGRIPHLSPSKGTKMYELRYYNTHLTEAQLLELSGRKLNLAFDTNPVGYWPLDNGGGICYSALDDDRRHCYVQSASPQYINDDGLLHNLGMRFKDGNYAKLSFDENGFRGSNDLHAALVKTAVGNYEVYLDDNIATGTNWIADQYQDANSLTMQVQFRTPVLYKQEMDKNLVGAPVAPERIELAGLFTAREKPMDNALNVEPVPLRLLSGRGSSLSPPTGLVYHIDTAGTRQNAGNCQYHPSHDQTIFTWQASADKQPRYAIQEITITAGSPNQLEVVVEEFLPEWLTTCDIKLVGVIRTAGSSTVQTTNIPALRTGLNTFVADTTEAVGVPADFTYVGAFVTVTPRGSNEHERRKVPLYRLVLTPEGRIAFDFFGDGRYDVSASGNWKHRSYYHRCESTTTLAADTVHTVTIVKQIIYESTGSAVVRKGFSIKMYDANFNILGQYNVIGTGTGISHANSIPFSRCDLTRLNYDLILGASYVGNGVDFSIDAPRGQNETWGSQYPEYVANHSLTSRADQPGDFTLGYFRMWQGSLSNERLAGVTNKSIQDIEEDSELLINVELDSVTGTRVPSRARFPAVFSLNHNSWSAFASEFVSTALYVRNSYQWSMEDCLGYGRKDSAFNPGSVTEIPCNFIGFYNATLTQRFGLATVFNDAILFDDDLSGTLSDLQYPVGGLLSDFVPGSQWTSTNIGDRLFIASPGNTPKVYNGRQLSPIWFTDYRGPEIAVEATQTTLRPAPFDTVAEPNNVWVGVVVAYFGASDNILQVSPRTIVQLLSDTTNQRISVIDVPQHPDPRVTTIRIYRTTLQSSRSLAEDSALLLCGGNINPNKFIKNVSLWEDDTELSVALDITVTPPPEGAYVASFADRLWIAGDPVFPDTVYYSRAGNPQEFDLILQQLVLEESSGDRINGLQAINGSLFVFKPSSIWRIDEVGGGGFVSNQISSIGAISDRSIALVTLPDEGRNVVAFWSKHGPYIFDGINLQYIGYPIEETTQNNPYEWLDDEDLFVMHHAPTRELAFFYREREATRVTGAVVYNYRYNTWSKWNGITASYSESSTTALQQATNLGESAVTLNSVQPQQYRTFLGGTNGVLYSWATSLLDGVLGSSPLVFSVSGYDAASAEITLNSAPVVSAGALRGVWLTVFNPANSDWIIVPIKDNNGAVLELDVFESLDFNPATGHTVYIAQQPLEIEYPWDVLDNPLSEKNGIQMIVHHEGAVDIYWAKDWKNSFDSSPNASIADKDGSRSLIRLDNVNAEALKIKMQSFSLEARIDSVAYRVNDAGGPNRTSQ